MFIRAQLIIAHFVTAYQSLNARELREPGHQTARLYSLRLKITSISGGGGMLDPCANTKSMSGGGGMLDPCANTKSISGGGGMLDPCDVISVSGGIKPWPFSRLAEPCDKFHTNGTAKRVNTARNANLFSKN